MSQTKDPLELGTVSPFLRRLIFRVKILYDKKFEKLSVDDNRYRTTRNKQEIFICLSILM